MSITANRLERFILQSMARQLLPKERVAKCLRVISSKQSQVKVFHSSLLQSAHYANLVTCASLWHCPICASKISERRRLILQPFVDNWGQMYGGSVLFLTLTMRHKRKEPLKHVLAGIIAASLSFRSGGWFKSFCLRFGIIGLIRALEITYGKNGWHPHLHFLIFTCQLVDLPDLLHEIRLKWRQVLKLHGRSASYERGADISIVDSSMPSYMLKMGLVVDSEDDDLAVGVGHWTAAHELVKASVKLGRNGSHSPLQLLRLAVVGDDKAAKLWQEYAITLKGHNHLVWSRGFKKFLGLQNKTDKQLVEQQDEMAVLLAQLNYDQWQLILKQELRGPLLQVASGGDVLVLQTWLIEHGIDGVELFDGEVS
jgi:hypothetical protein